MALLGLGLLASCGERPLGPSVVEYCEGLCTGAVRCDQSISYPGCKARCMADRADLADVRPETAAVVGNCLEHLDCPTLFDGPYTACWEKAEREVARSARVRSFCPQFCTSVFQCGAWYPVEDCLVDYNAWTDAYLDALAACTMAPSCDEEFACLDQVWGR